MLQAEPPLQARPFNAGALPLIPQTQIGPQATSAQHYCDDILIFSKTREAHLVHVRMVPCGTNLRHHKLHAKASKCQFGRSSVPRHLGARRRSDPQFESCCSGRVGQPSSCTDVRRFAGLAKYCRKFVLHFSTVTLAAPMTTLCRPLARRAEELQRAQGGTHLMPCP